MRVISRLSIATLKSTNLNIVLFHQDLLRLLAQCSNLDYNSNNPSDIPTEWFLCSCNLPSMQSTSEGRATGSGRNKPDIVFRSYSDLPKFINICLINQKKFYRIRIQQSLKQLNLQYTTSEYLTPYAVHLLLQMTPATTPVSKIINPYISSPEKSHGEGLRKLRLNKSFCGDICLVRTGMLTGTLKVTLIVGKQRVSHEDTPFWGVQSSTGEALKPDICTQAPWSSKASLPPKKRPRHPNSENKVQEACKQTSKRDIRSWSTTYQPAIEDLTQNSSWNGFATTDDARARWTNLKLGQRLALYELSNLCVQLPVHIGRYRRDTHVAPLSCSTPPGALVPDTSIAQIPHKCFETHTAPDLPRPYSITRVTVKPTSKA